MAAMNENEVKCAKCGSAEGFDLEARSSVTTPSWMRAPSGRCVVCGEELGAREHYIVDGGPNGEHLTCIDWSSRPWPFDRLERAVRTRLSFLSAAARAVEELSRYLARARDAWEHDVSMRPTIREVVRPRVEDVRAKLERAGARLGTVVEHDPRH